MIDKDHVSGYGFKMQDPENTRDQRYAALFPGERVVRIGAPDLDIRIKNATARPSVDGMEITAGDEAVCARSQRWAHCR